MLPGQELTVDLILRLLRRHWWLLIAPVYFGILEGSLLVVAAQSVSLRRHHPGVRSECRRAMSARP